MASIRIVALSQDIPLTTPVAWWTFDSLDRQHVIDKASGARDKIFGYQALLPGVRSNCLKLDGYTTRVIRASEQVPELTGGLTIEAWVAMQALPWNWTAIVSQSLYDAAGGSPHRLFFGIDAHGRLGFELRIDGKNYRCVTGEQLSLLEWNRVAATFNPESGMNVYINGRIAAQQDVCGMMPTTAGSDLFIGMNTEKLGPEGSERQASADLGSRMVLHGLLDELKLYNAALSEREVLAGFLETDVPATSPLEWPQLPSGPKTLDSRFDAIYSRLTYTDEWESQWKVGGFPDILVHFDRLPVRLIFWRGTGYGAVWVTENGRWMADQSLERANAGKSPMGCSEHMSDKQTRYSHVRILEKSPARIVIHWRYAIADILYDIFGITEEDPRGEWADEYYYIYPDGITVRHQVLYSRYLSHEWQETIVIHQPGTFPEDNISLDAMSLANMEGEAKTYSWAEAPPSAFPEPADANIQVVNLRSAFRPWIIFEPGPKIRPVNPDATRTGTSRFSWWNHWPVAQLPNDGRRAFGPDRPSHSSLSQSIEHSEVIHDNGDGTYAVMTLTGMSDRPIDSLVPLARSWNHPPKAELLSGNFSTEGYEKTQRAYAFRVKDTKIPLEFRLNADNDSPLFNPVFILEGWGDDDVRLTMNGRKLKVGVDFRIGYRSRLNSNDAVIWISARSAAPVTFRISRR
jgi:hypothetical protein